ncbi:MAG: pyridoxal-phosphate dependent enzyme [Bacillota bacterium]|nr:pyridoxal-phosphate dependent enzyme [Bacillota bacterium]
MPRSRADVIVTAVQYVGEADPDQCLEQVAGDLRRRGRRPYLIPVGGASSVGVLGYVLGATELVEQARATGLELDLVVVASGSGGTQAGLALGMHLVAPHIRVLGVSVGYPADTLRQRVADLAAGAARLPEVAASEPAAIEDYS